MIDSNTMYYTFSSIPQILGVLIAVLVAFVHFRITRLEDYLVGDGQATYNRLGEIGFILTKREQKRLLDAIGRKNIYESKNVLKKLSEIEKKEGHTKETRKTGLQVIYEDRFCGTLDQIDRLKKLTLKAVGLATFTIILSLLSLGLVDLILKCNCFPMVSLIINIILTIITVVLSYLVIYQGLIKKTLHETVIE